MNTGRWCRSLVRLPDERLLVLGGELNDPGCGRTNGCEIYEPRSNSWTNTGSFILPTEIPPALPLYAGAGTAVNGVDYNALSNFVVIPAGAFPATRTLTP